MGGFNEPILHGLCTLGWAVRSVTQAYGAPASVQSIRARFSASVYPGETLQTEMWHANDRVLFQVRVRGRDVIAISNGAVRYQPGTMAAKPTPRDALPGRAKL
jgi:acyl dehydratase